MKELTLHEIQQGSYKILLKFKEICEELNLKYFLAYGTLLGAVRHKGFIPWDDDTDVIFSRHEYAKFCKACKKELDKERFFLQDYHSDKEYRWGYAKLRRNGTEFIRLGQEHMNFRTGVFIDIFVADHMPDGYLSRRFFYGINFCIRKILYSELGMIAEKNAAMRKLYSFLYSLSGFTRDGSLRQ